MLKGDTDSDSDEESVEDVRRGGRISGCVSDLALIKKKYIYKSCMNLIVVIVNESSIGRKVSCILQ